MHHICYARKVAGGWGGGYFGVNFMHFVCQNHSIFFHKILYSFLSITLMVTTLKQCFPHLLGTIFRYMYIFFLVSIQYFLMKFCTGALGMTLIITRTKIFLTLCPPLQEVIWGILGPILAYYAYFLKTV